MTTQELIQLLRPIFKEVLFSEGKLSLVEAVDVIEKYKNVDNFTIHLSFFHPKICAVFPKGIKFGLPNLITH